MLSQNPPVTTTLVRCFLFDVINIRIFQLSIICKKEKYGERPNTRLLTPHTSTQFVHALKSKFQLSRLENKFIRWFNETKADGKDFEYRFTGRDSRMYLHHLMHLVVSLESPTDSARQIFRLHTFAYVSLQLRNAVSLFCRMTIIGSQLQELTTYCTNYFRACSLFLIKSPIPL